MFDVGQKVICVRKEPWDLTYGSGVRDRTPVFGEEVTVDRVIPEGTLVTPRFETAEDGLVLVEYPGAVFVAKFFRPKDPNIEALRSLITKLPAKQPEEV